MQTHAQTHELEFEEDGSEVEARRRRDYRRDVELYAASVRERDFFSMANLAGRLLAKCAPSPAEENLLAYHHFGVCPECYAPGVCRNIGRTHIFSCDRCRLRWCGGANVFSAWREESEEKWRENAAILATYQDAEPVHFLPRNSRAPAAVGEAGVNVTENVCDDGDATR